MGIYADSERGRYPIWQNLDHPNYFPGSKILFVTVTVRPTLLPPPTSHSHTILGRLCRTNRNSSRNPSQIRSDERPPNHVPQRHWWDPGTHRLFLPEMAFKPSLPWFLFELATFVYQSTYG